MATKKQKVAFDKMVENGGNVSKAMEAAGYSKATAHTPQKLTESKGFLELCNELGLTENLIVESLVSDIKSKPKERKPELELAAKLRGLLKDKTEHSVTDPVLALLNKFEVFNDRQDDGAVQSPSQSDS